VKQYRVDYRLDERGWWVASVRGIKGCHTQGRSIQQARRRVREALSLFLDEAVARGALLEDRIHLGRDVARIVAAQRAARRRAEVEREAAGRTMRAAVNLLTGRLKVSVRDASEILKLSHQRVQQLRRRPRSGQRNAGSRSIV
jgi:predicted RNase H-like HicB family nuclease